MNTNMESILTSVKKLIGMPEDYTVFDPDVIIHINSTFMILTQMGVGPETGFRIEDSSAVWSDFIPEEDLRFEAVKSYVGLKAQLFFDPPTSSILLDCKKQMIAELEWRLNLAAESD